MLEDLLQGRPMHPRLTQNLTLADALSQDALTNLKPLFHVAIHFLPFLR